MGGWKKTVSSNMSDNEVGEWGIDAVVAEPSKYFVETIYEVDNITYEEIGGVIATITENIDFTQVRMPIPKEILLRLEDGEAELRRFVERLKITGESGMFHNLMWSRLAEYSKVHNASMELISCVGAVENAKAETPKESRADEKSVDKSK